MTKSNSILHRAAALLAALCLLASMALPVYAAETETEFSVSSSETIPGDDNTGNGADGTGSDISVSNLETIQKTPTRQTRAAKQSLKFLCRTRKRLQTAPTQQTKPQARPLPRA